MVNRRSVTQQGPGRRGRFVVIGVSALALFTAAFLPGSAGATSHHSVAGKGQKIDFAADPPEGFEARDPNAPVAEPGTVHQITMHMTETVLEIAPGVKQEMWTFDKQVPGPMLRGKVGDTFEITIVNDGKIGHSIDFHSSKVAWNVEMRTIEPGEELLYTYVAKKAGIFMYHCGSAPVLHHIGNGMYGAIIIDPPDLAPVAHEYVMVQSELYTAPKGGVADLNKMLANKWDAVVFNGYPNQYKFQPIRVEPNEQIRIWVIDDGPSENS
ncbi:MAG: multicopper oxidase domain-containing protein, partial [Acidimicrobiia bacterium]|nr:multicopper oxidase domain-containing protein [Acidimicrobiia bacterium]